VSRGNEKHGKKIIRKETEHRDWRASESGGPSAAEDKCNERQEEGWRGRRKKNYEGSFRRKPSRLLDTQADSPTPIHERSHESGNATRGKEGRVNQA